MITKQPLKSTDGQTLKFFTILVGTSMGIGQYVHDIHTSIAYNQPEALADAKNYYMNTHNSGAFFFEVRKVAEVMEIVKLLKDHIDDQIFMSTKQPRFISKQAAEFVQKLIDAAPLLEEEETEQRILIKSLTKIKQLYGKNPQVSRPSPVSNIGSSARI